MQDEYANAMNFCHGDIYRNVMYARRKGNELVEGRWLGRLNSTLRSDLELFLKKEGYETLRMALQSLLPFPGLWPALKLGCLRRIFSVHQPEELAHYLKLTYNVWASVLLNLSDLFENLDYQTVRVLQLRNPLQYPADGAYIKAQIDGQVLFPNIKDQLVRSRILGQILNLKSTIPSIETFLEDLKWLEPCSNAIREHITRKSKGSLSKILSRGFDYQRHVLSNKIVSQDTDQKRAAFRVTYRMLFAFAWQHFPELSGISPKQDQGKQKQRPKRHNDLTEHEFKKYAFDLGFESRCSENELAISEQLMIKKFLQEIRPPDCFRLLEQEGRLLDQLHGLIQKTYQRCETTKAHKIEQTLLETRCGRPTYSSFNAARSCFDYTSLCSESNQKNGSYVDQRNIFIMFFGIDDNLAADIPNLQSQSADIYEFDSADDELESLSNETDAELFVVDSNQTSEEAAGSSPKRQRLSTPHEWKDIVFANARRLNQLDDTASSTSHILVVNLTERRLYIWRRGNLQELLQQNGQQSWVAEVSEMSASGSVHVLKNINMDTDSSLKKRT